MRLVEVTNPAQGTLLGSRIAVADTFWTRLRGLLGRPELTEGEGLWIRPSRGVHMYGMKQALDVAMLDAGHAVVALYPSLAPWDRTSVHREARSALELPPGTLERTRTREGDRLRVGEPVPAPAAHRA